MSGGFGAGFIKGLVAAGLLAGGVSLMLPVPPLDPGKTSQVDLATPADSGFNAARSDTSPVLPNSDQSVAIDTAPLRENRPENPVTPPVAPKADTPSAQPVAQGAVAAAMTAPKGEEIALNTPSGETAAPVPMAPLGVPMATIDNPVANLPTSRAPGVKIPPTTDIAGSPEIGPDGSSLAPSVATEQAPDQAPAQVMPPKSAKIPPAADPVMLRQNAVAFANPDNKPLFSVILIDAGSDGLDSDVLRTFSFPVTFALDPDSPGVTAKAKILSAAGFEILALAPKAIEDAAAAAPDKTISTDISATLTSALAKLPEAVGLVDRPAAKIQHAPKLADQVINNLLSSGRGLVTYDIGLNGTDQKARHSGLSAGTVYRVLDGQRESGTVIKRYLDRAALEAGKIGKVIVIGHTYPETVTALFSWAISAKSATIALAPVSATLLAR